ncbi:MAG: hypothetical protein H0Z37_11090 [Firmicutes bacterium]|nr:hypothetical protein [Bacillota bacterium]
MLLPNIPDTILDVSVTSEETGPMLLYSIAGEAMALAHILNAQAETLHCVIGMTNDRGRGGHTLADAMKLNDSARQVMNSVTLKETLLQIKLTDVKQFLMRHAQPRWTPMSRYKNGCCKTQNTHRWIPWPHGVRRTPSGTLLTT